MQFPVTWFHSALILSMYHFFSSVVCIPTPILVCSYKYISGADLSESLWLDRASRFVLVLPIPYVQATILNMLNPYIRSCYHTPWWSKLWAVNVMLVLIPQLHFPHIFSDSSKHMSWFSLVSVYTSWCWNTCGLTCVVLEACIIIRTK